MIEAVNNSHKFGNVTQTHLLRSKLLKTNGRKLAKYWLDLEDEEEEAEEEDEKGWRIQRGHMEGVRQ
jgi:hypothetical protein